MKHKILSLALLASLAVFTAAHAADWRMLATKDKDASAYFIDAETILPYESFTKAWIRWDVAPARTVAGTKIKWKSTVQLFYFDCPARKYQNVSWVYYPETAQRGDPVVNYDGMFDPQAMYDAVPASSIALFMDAACNRKYGAKAKR